MWWVVLLVLRGTTFGVDDLSYHAAVVAHWIVDGRMSLAPFNYHGYYPFNAEVLALWFILPFHADGWASLSGLYWGMLIAGAGISILVAQGYPRAISLFVGALLLISPVLVNAARSFSAVDLASPALSIAALALATPSRDNQTVHATLVDAAYAGLLAGFAAGCKVSFSPIVPILLFWQAFGPRKQQPARTRVSAAVIFAATAATTGAYWYARNWWLTGNPLFPAAFGPFDGPFRAAEQSRTTLIHWIMASPTDANFWFPLIKQHMNWPLSLCLLSIVGYGSAIITVIRHRRTTDSSNTAVISLLLLTGLALIVAYPFMPFSATDNDPDGLLNVRLRFLIAPFAIGIILFGSNVRPDHPRRALWVCVAVLAVATSGQFSGRAAFFMMGAGAVASWVWQSMQQATLSERILPALRLSSLPVILLLVALLTPYKQRLTDLGIYTRGEPEHPIGHAWQALEKLQAGARVVWFGPAAYQYYPLFGRRLQLVPVALNYDGSPQRPLHELFRREPIQWWNDDRDDRDLRDMAPNLIAAGVGYVLVSKWNLDKWPSQHEALANSGRTNAIYDDMYSVIWKIGGMNR